MNKEQPQEQPTDEQPPPDAVEVDQEVEPVEETANAEAAKYRVRLRETEARRDQLAQQVEILQRAQVDGHIAALGLKPAAVWASGAELPDLLTDDGVPDPDKIVAAVETAKTTLGIGRTQPPARGLKSGATHNPPKVDTWQRAFAPRER